MFISQLQSILTFNNLMSYTCKIQLASVKVKHEVKAGCKLPWLFEDNCQKCLMCEMMEIRELALGVLCTLATGILMCSQWLK